MDSAAVPLLGPCWLSPIPAFPPRGGKETPPRAATELTYSSILLPHNWGKETQPRAATELTYSSIFLPHLWGRTEEGDSQHGQEGIASTF
ncbi:hypothetical protein AC790_12805 [Pantoea sp. RIT-PI-b]|nr:hypothetical protein AC790_12805 [Pantoea sp. RIT-PI-b]